MNMRHKKRKHREMNYNLFSYDMSHGYLRKRKQLPGGVYSPFLEVDTKIPYFRKNRKVKSRFMDPIGRVKKKNNLLGIMDDYAELKEARERKQRKRRNIENLRS
jgi:hypothetical protein